MSEELQDAINRYGTDRVVLYTGLAVMLVGVGIAQLDYYVGGTIALLACFPILYGVMKVGYDV